MIVSFGLCDTILSISFNHGWSLFIARFNTHPFHHFEAKNMENLLGYWDVGESGIIMTLLLFLTFNLAFGIET